MYRVSKDRRFVKNRKALEHAFIRLALQKPYSHITVTDIAKEAGVNRMTFYSHYSSIEDIIREIAAIMVGDMEAHAGKFPVLDVRSVFFSADEYRQRNPEFFMLVAKDPEFQILRDMINGKMKELVSLCLSRYSTLSGGDLDVCAGVISSGVCNTYWDWVVGEYGDISLDRLAFHFQRLVDGSIGNL